jgi:hypothetical protein
MRQDATLVPIVALAMAYSTLFPDCATTLVGIVEGKVQRAQAGRLDKLEQQQREMDRRERSR